ncbi:GrpE-domain-containing protein [Exidia glandulosa HHB12029]|uniref:GrpE protein homolog n=1 Tax=Exidia glandulosa HHB12029 TaxID=1314781 RepID=A0A165IGJ5_EXIGL|nr:GrpE-domain-containing protein [Exidia glandulosa HHB12029]
MSASTRALRSCTGILRTPIRSQARLISPVAATRFRRTMSTGTEQTSDAAQQSADGAQPAADTPEAKLKAKDAEIADLKSRLRYAQADLINQQKIAAREKEQQRDFAISRFALDLLETADVLSLALRSLAPPANASPETQSKLDEGLRAGIDMTQKQLLSTFAKYNVVPFDPTGEKFDPNRHEALYEAPAPPGKEPGTVIDCQKVGYLIKDRTLRAAQVGVARSE